MRRLLLSLLLCLPLSAWAVQPEARGEADGPPPPTHLIDDGVGVEPEVRITKNESGTVEEYRVNGQLYLVKVTPPIGEPYYLYDEDGSGQMKRFDHRGDRMVIPRWVLIRF